MTTIRHAVDLRAAALTILAGREPDWTRLEHCSADTWKLFLRTERCALALKSRLTAAGCAVPDRARAEIERAATPELQRILSARGQLLRIGRLAAAHGIAGVVLKGGVAALASAAPVDLHDVDVLVRPLQAEQLAGLLDEEGFHATGPAGTAHLAQRIAPNTVQIEVHFALNDIELSDAMWNRARPLDGAAGLSRLGAPDHVWHLLVHSVVSHPYRRGSLRDVLLIADALRDCSPTELEEVERRSASHRLARTLHAQLEMARELGAGGPVRPVPARSGGELSAAGAAWVAGILALLDDRLLERTVRAARRCRGAAARVGVGVAAPPVFFPVGIRSPAGAPCAAPGEIVSHRGEGHAADGVSGGRVAGGGGGAHPHSLSTWVLTPLIPSPLGPHPFDPLSLGSSPL